jgi:hypothetical protein
MKATHDRARWGLMLVSALLFAGMLACQSGAGQVPTVQVTFPPTGRQVAVGDVVPIHSISQDDRGVTKVELWVGGQLLETTSAPSDQKTFAAVQNWMPSQAGIFDVGVRAYDSDGQVSEPALITIEVVSTVAEVTQPLPEEPASPTQAPQAAPPPSGQGPSEQPTPTPLTAVEAPPPAFATVGGGPDLECANWTYQGFPDPVIVGQPVVFEVWIWNSGNLQAFNFRWGVQPISPAAEFMESQETISLNGDQEGTFTWQGDPIVYDQPGQYTMVMMVDLHDAVDEVNEDNNRCQGQITVVEPAAPTATLASWSGKTIFADAARSGHLSGGGVFGDAVVGDDSQNGQLKGFLTFDLSGIPAGATINAATLNLGSYQREGNPFNSLGALRALPGNFGGLDSGDWNASVIGTAGYYEEPADLQADQDVLTSVKRAFEQGWGSYQLRLEFSDPTDGDNNTDVFWFNVGAGGVRLLVTYTAGG